MCLVFACFALPVLSFLLKRTNMKSKEFEFQKDRCDIWAIEIEPRKQNIMCNICLSVRCQKEWPNKPLSVYFNAVDGEKTSVFGVIVLRPRPYVYGCFSLRFNSIDRTHRIPIKFDCPQVSGFILASKTPFVNGAFAFFRFELCFMQNLPTPLWHTHVVRFEISRPPCWIFTW